jgi:hypothetical protein
MVDLELLARADRRTAEPPVDEHVAQFEVRDGDGGEECVLVLDGDSIPSADASGIGGAAMCDG